MFPTRVDGARGDGLNRIDANIQRDFRLTERFTLQLRMDALNAAKEILMAHRETIVVPGYVSSAINGGVMDERSADWARGQVAVAIRRNPTLCGPNDGGFTWSRLQLDR